MTRSFRSLAILTAIALVAPAGATLAREQLVLVSFDGAHDLARWDRARKIGAETGARFTFFLSCTFVLDPSIRAEYRAPRQEAGRSATGFALTRGEVQARLGAIWQAHLAGHEIASHACGHFDGKDWTAREWTTEFSSFSSILKNAWVASGFAELEPEGWRDFVARDIKGFRAPYLSTGPGLYQALAETGFTYDASLVTDGPALPRKEGGITRFGLPLIPEGPKGRKVIAMDYNLFMRHSRGEETPERAGEFAGRTLEAFRAAFDEQYRGNRVPLQIGFHFSAMNGGAYWDALEQFLRETCGKPEVACVSYAQAMTRSGETSADNSAY